MMLCGSTTPTTAATSSLARAKTAAGTPHALATAGNQIINFDATGNRTAINGSAPTLIGDENRITDDGTFTYAYDAEGNVTRKTEKSSGQNWRYTWDHRNRLKTASLYSATDQLLKQVRHLYDSFDRWVGQLIDGNGDSHLDGTRQFVHDDGQITLAYEDGQLTNRYLREPGNTMKTGFFWAILLIGATLTLGCHSSDEHYFRRTTERRLEDLATAAAVLSETQQPNDMNELLKLATDDGLIPRGDGDSLRKDAWGTPIRFEKDANGPSNIRSAGEDLTFSTSDDIVKSIQETEG